MIVTSSMVTEKKYKDFVVNNIMQMSFPILDKDRFEALYKIGVSIKEISKNKYKQKIKMQVSEEAKKLAENLSYSL